jgi:hypothetical protein
MPIEKSDLLQGTLDILISRNQRPWGVIFKRSLAARFCRLARFEELSETPGKKD